MIDYVKEENAKALRMWIYYDFIHLLERVCVYKYLLSY
jgi:hypothetical protein